MIPATFGGMVLPFIALDTAGVEKIDTYFRNAKKIVILKLYRIAN